MSKRQPGFRDSMEWLHTWTGVVVGALLFTIFWMGTLSVFDKEIDRWMMPQMRGSAAPVPAPSAIDIDSAIEALSAAPSELPIEGIYLSLPTARTPVMTGYVSYAAAQEGTTARSGEESEEEAQYIARIIEPSTGEFLGEPDSHAGTSFFFPFHFRLHIPGNLGYWLVGFAALSMLTMLISGVIIHRKIFVDFFTFRPRKHVRRSTLDLHNVTGVLLLPFTFMFALSGLIIFAGWYASLPWQFARDLAGDETVALYDHADHYAHYEQKALGEPGELTAIAPLLAQAEAIWTERYGQPARADGLNIQHAGDANALVAVRRTFPEQRVEMGQDIVYFHGVTGEQLADFTPSPIFHARQWLEGLHFVQFRHVALRWFYFAAGLGACVMIGTGFLFWSASRRATRAGKADPLKVRVVDSLSVGTVAGIILASVAYLVFNRLLAIFGGPEGHARADLEALVFFIVWIGTFVHAAIRGRPAWGEQAWVIGALAVAAPVLNWLTTADNPVSAALTGHWAILAMDLVLIAFAAAAIATARRLTRPAVSTGSTRQAPDALPVPGDSPGLAVK
ncbi:MAG: PepSY-associated TM helix domain-containing protein [Pseudomonadota bacterium]